MLTIMTWVKNLILTELIIFRSENNPIKKIKKIKKTYKQPNEKKMNKQKIKIKIPPERGTFSLPVKVW